jgi:hypothetical protein
MRQDVIPMPWFPADRHQLGNGGSCRSMLKSGDLVRQEKLRAEDHYLGNLTLLSYD